MKKYVVPGVLLILAGLYLLLDVFFQFPAFAFVIAIGLGFLLCRAITGYAGLTIPGCILLCLGTGLTLQFYFPFLGGAFPIMVLSLSVAFLLIHILDFRRLGNWPLIPAAVLFVVSALILINTNHALMQYIRPFAPYILPAALILLGLAFLVSAVGRKGKEPAVRRSVNTAPPQSPSSAPGGSQTQQPFTYYQPPLNNAQAPQVPQQPTYAPHEPPTVQKQEPLEQRAESVQEPEAAKTSEVIFVQPQELLDAPGQEEGSSPQQ